MALLDELKRRRVFRAILVWGVFAFAVLQIIEPVMHGLHWPDAMLGYVVVALALGFPLVAGLGWVFDVKAGGLERTKSTVGPQVHGIRLALVLAGIGALAAVPGVAWYLFFRQPAQAGLPGTPAAQGSIPSVAVLPFADMSPQHDQDYFSDGIAEEVLNSLAQVEGLRVIGRTSSFSFKGKNEDLRTIGKSLGAGHLLEGSVRKSGSRVRITAQLIEAGGGSRLWSQSFERELTDVFAVQDEIAKAVVEALKVRLLAGAAPPKPERRPAHPEAYSQYLLGKQLLNRGLPEEYQRAVSVFEQAVALDPGQAPAWAGLANALFAVADLGDLSGAETLALQQRALETVSQAVARGPDVADAYSARGWMRMRVSWDWAGARADFERALALAPGDAVTVRQQASLLATLGHLPEAIAKAERAIELDPLEARAWSDLGSYRVASGQLEAGRKALNRALEIAPAQFYGLRELGFLALLESKPAEALVLFNRTSVAWSRLSGAALAEFDLGRAKESQAALDELIARFSQIGALQIAEVYAWRADPDRAFVWLDRALETRDTGLARVKLRLLLRKIRGDPRYPALLRKLNLPVD